ncbi:hypothetical protein FRC01_006569, partial [Tulasnella sp. 417]
APVAVEFEDLQRAVRSAQRFLGETIRMIAAEGRSQRSSPSYLPVEVFSYIVKNVLEDSESHHKGGYYGQLGQLCLVCKGWADRIHNIPELWTGIDLSQSEEFLRLLISRSGCFPLDVGCDLDYLPPMKHSIIKSEAYRWRSLDIRSDHEHPMETLLANPAPRLQELTLEGPRAWAPSTNVFEGTAPKLEVVVVKGCGLPWRSPIFSDLKKLTLWEIEEHPPQLEALLDILTSSPRLSELAISVTSIQLDTYNASRRVTLPNLQSLVVEYLDPEIMAVLLNSIEAPPSAAIFLGTVLEGDEEMALELEDVSTWLVARARSVRSGICTLSLKMGCKKRSDWSEGEDGDWNATLKYETEGNHLGTLSIRVNAPAAQHVGVLSYLAGKIQPYTEALPNKIRFVDINRDCPEKEDTNLLCAMHRTFPDIREIELVNLEYRAMIDALGRLFPRPGSGTSPLFPHLTTLTVNRSGHRPWVGWLQANRKQTDEGGVSPLPHHLTLRLEEGEIDVDGLQALQKLVSGPLSLDNVQVK